MELAVIAGVVAVLFLAVIAIGGAVYHTLRNRRLGASLPRDTLNDFLAASSTEPIAMETLFFKKGEQDGKTVKFYVSAPSLGIDIPSDRAIDCDYEEICLYVDRLYDNTEDNFFTLEDDKGSCIQFCHDGQSTTVDIDIPDASQKGSYQGSFSSLSDVKTCIGSFFRGVDIPFNYSLTFQTW